MVSESEIANNWCGVATISLSLFFPKAKQSYNISP